MTQPTKRVHVLESDGNGSVLVPGGVGGGTTETADDPVDSILESQPLPILDGLPSPGIEDGDADASRAMENGTSRVGDDESHRALQLHPSLCDELQLNRLLTDLLHAEQLRLGSLMNDLVEAVRETEWICDDRARRTDLKRTVFLVVLWNVYRVNFHYEHPTFPRRWFSENNDAYERFLLENLQTGRRLFDDRTN